MKTTRVVFLESLAGVESLLTRNLRRTALLNGSQVEVLFLADAEGNLRAKESIQAELVQKNPDLICFLMDAPLDWPDIWNHSVLRDKPKVSLWFDDFYRSPRTLKNPRIWATWQATYRVRVGIWDGYWRRQWEVLTGGIAFPIHLAADPNQFSPKNKPMHLNWEDRAIFVGTIPSLASLEEGSETLPAVLKKLLKSVIATLQADSWPLRPYEASLRCRAELSSKVQAAIAELLADSTTLAWWNHLLWRWGKRIARLRGIQAIGKVGPVAILSGHGTERYAGETELAAEFPESMDWVYADTKNIAPSHWGSLFRCGKWHLQITDPQSIDGGLPYRVFESAACAMPLLSDYRQELVELFPPTTGLVTARDEEGMQEVAERLFQAHPAELLFRGGLMHQRFQDAHTWEKRWSYLLEVMSQESYSLRQF